MPFYGSPPELGRGRARSPARCSPSTVIKTTRLMSNLPEVSKAMSEAGVDFTSQVYRGVGHAFFNDTNPHTFDAGFCR